MADDYGYCHVSIGDSTLCFVDNTPEKHYKYVLVKDTPESSARQHECGACCHARRHSRRFAGQ